MKTYTIKKFAEKVGVYVGTIRNYQKRGMLKDKRNPVNNYRIFDDTDVEAITRLIKPE